MGFFAVFFERVQFADPTGLAYRSGWHLSNAADRTGARHAERGQRDPIVGYDCGAKGAFKSKTALKLEPQLSAAAQAHADDMKTNDYLSHTAPDGSTVGTRVTRTGYRWSGVGEHITQGYKNVDEVMSGWLKSDGHCANLINPGFSELGSVCQPSSSFPCSNQARQFQVLLTTLAS